MNSNFREFPYGPFPTLDITNKFNYEICWLYQVVSFTAFGLTCATVDLLICSVLMNICYQFKVLQNFLKQMVEVSHKRIVENKCLPSPEKVEIDTSIIPCKYLEETLKTAVSYHVAILDIASEIEATFSELLLLAFLVTLAVLCISVYQLAMATTLVSTVRHVFEVTVGVLQVAVYCYWGEQVTQESQTVGFYAYNANFTGSDLKFQRALTLIIRRSQTPTVITAGGFTDIGLPTFFWMLHTSYSAFMVMRNTSSER
ncbi:hypothetical protein ILUMI_25967 [Ignelater luminosus]|uniref:Uncharacterized protein n=1 Tax=Ignelater luminosus TaxID=2038154 RepID=A0A8K0C4S2_IGNLU|nr:hypothetical protein ILUMI_25967 [Ignelater luminosus]